MFSYLWGADDTSQAAPLPQRGIVLGPQPNDNQAADEQAQPLLSPAATTQACETCNGTGVEIGYIYGESPCSVCRGTGKAGQLEHPDEDDEVLQEGKVDPKEAKRRMMVKMRAMSKRKPEEQAPTDAQQRSSLTAAAPGLPPITVTSAEGGSAPAAALTPALGGLGGLGGISFSALAGTVVAKAEEEEDKEVAMEKKRLVEKAKKIKDAILDHTVFMMRCLMLFMLVIHVQDLVTDIILAKQMWNLGLFDHAILTMLCVQTPAIMMGMSEIRRLPRRWGMGFLSFLHLSYFVYWLESYRMGALMKDMRVSADVYSIFESLPQFMLQTFIVMGSAFHTSDCETAFDMVCTAGCPHTPPKFALTGFSRFACNDFATRAAATEHEKAHVALRDQMVGCWRSYTECVASCPATMMVESKKKELGGYMRKHSELWVTNHCDANGAKLKELFPEAPAADFRHGIVALQYTWKVKVLQILTLLSSLCSQISTFTFRVMRDRYGDEDDDGMPDNVTTEYNMEFLGFATHFFFDICSTCSAMCFYMHSLYYGSKASALIVLALIGFQVMFHFGLRAHKQDGWIFQRRIIGGACHMFISPLARLPDMPDMPARFVRRVIPARFLFQLSCVWVGFANMAVATSWDSWANECLLCTSFAVLGAFCTYLPGPKLVYDDAAYERKVYERLQSQKNRANKSWSARRAQLAAKEAKDIADQGDDVEVVMVGGMMVTKTKDGYDFGRFDGGGATAPKPKAPAVKRGSSRPAPKQRKFIEETLKIRAHQAQERLQQARGESSSSSSAAAAAGSSGDLESPTPSKASPAPPSVRPSAKQRLRGSKLGASSLAPPAPDM